MLKVVLPDGKEIEFKESVTVKDIASAIGPGLLKAAIAGQVNGKSVDLSYLVKNDAEVRIITLKNLEGLEILRHSAAHLLAHAVTDLFPGVQVTVGPSIEDGFYHDFYYPKGFSEDDLVKIEAKMHELVKSDQPIVRSVKGHNDAISFFEERGENYKVEMVRDIPEGEDVSFYEQGNFINVCRGPHVPSTGYIKAFKLTKISGAYWRGDSKNEMLQRIYGTAWATEKELKQFLGRLEQAKLRDHRIIAKKMDLFHMQEEAPGMAFWHPKGWTIYTVIKNYLSARLKEFGYEEIATPLMLERVLWEKSGHWDKFREVMFTSESENHIYAIKPMSCPGHVQVFKQGIKSYRDLPVRYSEFGCCHRNEISGSLHGIMRVREFTQDDGHIFCTEDQIFQEAFPCIKQVLSVYADFGFKDVIIKFATRPEQRIGDDAVWDKAEKALADVLDKSNIEWQLAPGDGAFYGPKIEFSLKDCLGRVWQCGTLQVDLSTAKRLGAYYVTESGEKKHPVLLHRAMLGSIERFIGILLEETNGELPIWLAPIQAVVANITDDQAEYAEKVTQELKEFGKRVSCDLRNEKIGFKIREHSIAKVPFMLIVGDKEVATNTVSVRTADGKDLGQMSIENVVSDVLGSGFIEKI